MKKLRNLWMTQTTKNITKKKDDKRERKERERKKEH